MLCAGGPGVLGRGGASARSEPCGGNGESQPEDRLSQGRANIPHQIPFYERRNQRRVGPRYTDRTAERIPTRRKPARSAKSSALGERGKALSWLLLTCS